MAKPKQDAPAAATLEEVMAMPPNKVTPITAFLYAGELFMPGREYWVPDNVLNGQLEDGRQFADLVQRIP